MNISMLCKLIALRELYETLEVSPGSGLLYFELQRLWQRTGLRDADLPEAIASAILSGELFEIETHEGHLAVLTDAGYQVANGTPGFLDQIEQHAQALLALEWAKSRRRQGSRSGRRRDDQAFRH